MFFVRRRPGMISGGEAILLLISLSCGVEQERGEQDKSRRMDVWFIGVYS